MTQPVNKQAVAKAFGRAASHYDQHAELQRLSGEALLALAPTAPGRDVLDIGCGTGLYSRYWRARGHHVTALDLSSAMLDQTRAADSADEYVQADLDALPLPAQSMDLVWSNLAVQWSSDLGTALQQQCRLLRSGGSVMFSTLLEASLQEVNQAWQVLDRLPHTNRFLSQHQVIAAAASFPLRYQTQQVTLHFPTALAAMRSLKGIGATHLHHGRRRALLTRQGLAQLEQSWPQDQQGYRLSYHLFFGVITL
ncbi:malonyl-ACP O-methyltransferase BioC [Candidatus Pantoea multigeneris]|uniref:Malonyl-[acyl-carrier protein] O-methyltransferase n=1 Tax=Candidatus Pantoea multigeneris TaxID=2608357 RepID=A0ABX0R9E8_9GAMM|nr:malonyl-ACP O-methyltransferase BioC [Pantoea multigeneris]NIF20763.1 malonyl-ACP O-methyltransferase BioC [Pantoea multigeneris]